MKHISGKTFRLKFKGKNYEKAIALAQRERMPLSGYLTDIVNDFLNKKYMPRRKKGSKK